MVCSINALGARKFQFLPASEIILRERASTSADNTPGSGVLPFSPA